MKRLLAALAGALVVLGTACDPNDPRTWVHAAQVAVNPTETATPDIRDYTGEVLPILETTFTTGELLAGGHVVINWGPERDDYSAYVPHTPNYHVECMGAPNCIVFNYDWWTTTWAVDQSSANRVLVAHEYAHVLSLKRKRTDTEYGKAVGQVDEECLADAVASLVLARGGYRPSVTQDYAVAYSCEQFWQDTYGESRQATADALAADLLHWAQYGVVVEITGPAVATEGAERIPIWKW